MPFFNNEVKKANNEIVSQELFFKKTLGAEFGSQDEYVVGKTDCFAFSFIKISCATTCHIKLKVIWSPTFSFAEYTNYEHFDDPENAVFNVAGNRSAKTILLTYTEEELEIQKDKYKFFVLPIQGEMVEIKIIPQVELDGKKGVMVRCALSNNFHNVIND